MMNLPRNTPEDPVPQDPMTYSIPSEPYRTEETIKRSRFISSVAHAPTEEEAKAFIRGIRAEFPDATHNCWAYVAGPPGDTARVGMSDDGEPHGTAGKPMLTVLLHSGIGEVAAVVTRYYGGTKLGKGGLVRAYSGAVRAALEGLGTREKVDLIILEVTLDYPRIAAVKQAIESLGSRIVGERYEADVSLDVELPREKEDRLVRAIMDLTGGQARISR